MMIAHSFSDPLDRLLAAVMLQAVVDNDEDFIAEWAPIFTTDTSMARKTAKRPGYMEAIMKQYGN